MYCDQLYQRNERWVLIIRDFVSATTAFKRTLGPNNINHAMVGNGRKPRKKNLARVNYLWRQFEIGEPSEGFHERLLKHIFSCLSAAEVDGEPALDAGR